MKSRALTFFVLVFFHSLFGCASAKPNTTNIAVQKVKFSSDKDVPTADEIATWKSTPSTTLRSKERIDVRASVISGEQLQMELARAISNVRVRDGFGAVVVEEQQSDDVQRSMGLVFDADEKERKRYLKGLKAGWNIETPIRSGWAFTGYTASQDTTGIVADIESSKNGKRFLGRPGMTRIAVGVETDAEHGTIYTLIGYETRAVLRLKDFRIGTMLQICES